MDYETLAEQEHLTNMNRMAAMAKLAQNPTEEDSGEPLEDRVTRMSLNEHARESFMVAGAVEAVQTVPIHEQPVSATTTSFVGAQVTDYAGVIDSLGELGVADPLTEFTSPLDINDGATPDKLKIVLDAVGHKIEDFCSNPERNARLKALETAKKKAVLFDAPREYEAKMEDYRLRLASAAGDLRRQDLAEIRYTYTEIASIASAADQATILKSWTDQTRTFLTRQVSDVTIDGSIATHPVVTDFEDETKSLFSEGIKVIETLARQESQYRVISKIYSNLLATLVRRTNEAHAAIIADAAGKITSALGTVIDQTSFSAMFIAVHDAVKNKTMDGKTDEPSVIAASDMSKIYSANIKKITALQNKVQKWHMLLADNRKVELGRVTLHHFLEAQATFIATTITSLKAMIPKIAGALETNNQGATTYRPANSSGFQWVGMTIMQIMSVLHAQYAVLRITRASFLDFVDHIITSFTPAKNIFAPWFDATAPALPTSDEDLMRSLVEIYRCSFIVDYADEVIKTFIPTYQNLCAQLKEVKTLGRHAKKAVSTSFMVPQFSDSLRNNARDLSEFIINVPSFTGKTASRIQLGENYDFREKTYAFIDVVADNLFTESYTTGTGLDMATLFQEKAAKEFADGANWLTTETIDRTINMDTTVGAYLNEVETQMETITRGTNVFVKLLARWEVGNWRKNVVQIPHIWNRLGLEIVHRGVAHHQRELTSQPDSVRIDPFFQAGKDMNLPVPDDTTPHRLTTVPENPFSTHRVLVTPKPSESDFQTDFQSAYFASPTLPDRTDGGARNIPWKPFSAYY